jgi:hypothetical protein
MHIEHDGKFLALVFTACVAGGFLGMALGFWVFA